MSKRPNDRKGEIPQDRAAERRASMSETAPHGGSDTVAEQRQSQTAMELLQRGLVDDALILCERLAQEYPALAVGDVVGANGCSLMPQGTALNDFVDLWKLRFLSGDSLTQDRMRKLAPWLYGQGVAPLRELPRDLGNPDAVLTPPEPITKPQPDRDVVIPAALASLWRAMLALPTGHPALRSLQKCEDAGSAEAVPMLTMCAAALRLMHLNASAERVERALELLGGLRSAAT